MITFNEWLVLEEQRRLFDRILFWINKHAEILGMLLGSGAGFGGPAAGFGGIVGGLAIGSATANLARKVLARRGHHVDDDGDEAEQVLKKLEKEAPKDPEAKKILDDLTYQI